jgi:peptidoglycan/xylan/chitin deacetylase (PgdA/CDA1 family)
MIILFYHTLLNEENRGEYFLCAQPTVEQFRAQIEYLRRRRTIVSTEQIGAHVLLGAPLPRNALAITFDDGFRNVLMAAEVLQEMSLPSTCFVTTGPVRRECVPWYVALAEMINSSKQQRVSWRDRHWTFGDFGSRLAFGQAAKQAILSVPPDQMDDVLVEVSKSLNVEVPLEPSNDLQFLKPEEVAELTRMGMNVGAHSWSHVNLPICDDQRLKRELVDPKQHLAEMLGKEVTEFSYPDGRWDERVRDEAMRHYKIAYSTSRGIPNDPGTVVRREIRDGQLSSARSALSWFHPWWIRVRHWGGKKIRAMKG